MGNPEQPILNSAGVLIDCQKIKLSDIQDAFLLTLTGVLNSRDDPAEPECKLIALHRGRDEPEPEDQPRPGHG